MYNNIHVTVTRYVTGTLFSTKSKKGSNNVPIHTVLILLAYFILTVETAKGTHLTLLADADSRFNRDPILLIDCRTFYRLWNTSSSDFMIMIELLHLLIRYGSVDGISELLPHR